MSLGSLVTDARYLFALARALRFQLTPEEARAEVERRLATRNDSFLDIVRRGIYDNPAHPYSKLLAHAGVEYGDIEKGVRADGLEPTLERLYDAGVYVTSEETKGRRPIKRNGIEIPTRASDFDNPLLGGSLMRGESSGSSGNLISYQVSLLGQARNVMDFMISTLDQQRGRPIASWNANELYGIFWFTVPRYKPARIFFTHEGGPRQQFSMRATRIFSRLWGFSLPKPIVVPRNNAIVVARWLAEMVQRGTPAAIVTHANPAVRICIAARENGLDLTGTAFSVGGEPFTPGKAAAIASVGGTATVSFGSIEIGGLAAKSCYHGEADEMHLFTHRVALIQRPREVFPGQTVGALVFSSVHQDNSKLLLNADCGDYADVTYRDCDCLMGQIGLRTRISGMRSYEKLTSEGITFIGSRLYELIEEILPARFGGGPNDYQLVEEEQDDGLSVISIHVAPTVGEVDEAAVISTTLQVLESRHEGGGNVMAEMWRQGGNLRVVRREPFATRTMKIQPLHVLRRALETARSD